MKGFLDGKKRTDDLIQRREGGIKRLAAYRGGPRPPGKKRGKRGFPSGGTKFEGNR